MSSNTPKSKTLIYLTGALATAVISIGGYYLYNYFTTDPLDELIDDAMRKTIEQLKEDIIDFRKGTHFNTNNKEGEIAFRISNEINRLSQKYYEVKYSYIDTKRRSSINNPDLYKDICDETLLAKEECVSASSKRILKLLNGSIDSDTIENWIRTIEPVKLEEYIIKYTATNYSANTKLASIEVLKEAYAYYAQLVHEEHEALSQCVASSMEDESKTQEMMFFYSMVIKLKVDDRLFLKYGLIEETLRYGLKEKNMLNDPDILKIQDNINKLIIS